MMLVLKRLGTERFLFVTVSSERVDLKGYGDGLALLVNLVVETFWNHQQCFNAEVWLSFVTVPDMTDSQSKSSHPWTSSQL